MNKLALALLVLAACTSGPVEDAREPLADTCVPTPTVVYTVKDTVQIGNGCEGVLPLLSFVTLYSDGTAFVEGVSDTGTIALWKKDNQQHLVLSFLSVMGWRTDMVLSPVGTGYGGTIEWFNPVVNKTCHNWKIELHL